MSDRLAGVRSKIDRAKYHVRDLERQVLAFVQPNANAVRFEDDPHTGEKVARVWFSDDILLDMALVVGDAVHNLRSALEHLAWQLVKATGGTGTRDTGYPIFYTAAKYVAHSSGKVQGISAAAERIIESTQPYNAGYEGMGRLQAINNFDKHQLLVVAATRVHTVWFGGDCGHPGDAAGGPPESGFRVTTGPLGPNLPPVFLKNGDEIGRQKSFNETEKQVDAGYTFNVAFREPGVVAGEPLLPLLTQLVRLIEGVVGRFASGSHL